MQRLLVFALCAMLFCASNVVIAQGADAVQTSWMGATLGEPGADVLQRLGDTGYIPQDATGEVAGVGYVVDRGSASLTIAFRHRRASVIAVGRSMWSHGASPSIVDPHGIGFSARPEDVIRALGPSEPTVANGRTTYTYPLPNGTVWSYSFMDSKLQTIRVALPDATIDALSPAQTIHVHSGASFEDALVDAAPDESSGVANEHEYLLFQHCEHGGHWRMQSQALTNHEGHPYDVLTLGCADGATKTLYIDIRAFFGKI